LEISVNLWDSLEISGDPWGSLQISEKHLKNKKDKGKEHTRAKVLQYIIS
jgi:hypothetical protein